MGFEFGIKDIIDILLVGTIMYWVYKLLKRSGATNLFWGIMLFVLIWFFVCFIFNLELTGALFNRIISVGAIALIIIFQEELRNLIYRIGSRFSIKALLRRSKDIQHDHTEAAKQIVTACRHMADTKTGALIVIGRESSLKAEADSGEYINSKISSRLIENIFFKNTPLHDGALIVSNGKLMSAACILPVSKNTDIPKRYGLRHRAALGITEKTDATAIVVSEETGTISVAKGESIKTIESQESLLQTISGALGL